MKRITFILLLLFIFNNVNAQKVFNEGKIVFEVSIPEEGTGNDAMDQMIPKEATMYMKKEKSRLELLMPMGMNVTTISDAQTKSTVILMDIMGNKMALKNALKDSDKKKVEQSKITVKLLPETKMIAGYKCKKAEITSEKGKKSYVYYTKDIAAGNINAAFNSPLGEIDGFPMQFESKQNGGSMKMTVKSIQTMKVDDDKFTIPAGYKETTGEQMSKMFGGK